MSARVLLLFAIAFAACADRPLGDDTIRISGLVEVAPSQPASHVTVALPDLDLSTQTDEDGQFTFSRLPRALVHLMVSAPFTIESVVIVDCDTRAGEGAALHIVLTGVGTLKGTVTDSAHIPIAGAHVAADEASTLTDSAGHYSMPVAIGKHQVVFAATGYAPQSPSVIDIAWGDSRTLDAALGTETSSSIAHGTVHRVGANGDHSGITVHLVGTPFGTSTDALGNFAIADVPEGLYSVEISYGAFSEQIDNVMLSGGTLYLFDSYLSVMPTLELLQGRRIADGLADATVLDAAHVLLRQSTSARVADVTTGDIDYVGAALIEFSIAPHNTSAYSVRSANPALGIAASGQLIPLISLGGTTTDTIVGTALGWLSETEVVVAQESTTNGAPAKLFRATQDGTVTPLQTSTISSWSALDPWPEGDSTTQTFFWDADGALERRSLVDGTVLDTQPHQGPVACIASRCLFHDTGQSTYHVAYSDGTFVDTQIEIAATVPSPAPPFLYGAARIYSYAGRTSFAHVPATLGEVGWSPGGVWGWIRQSATVFSLFAPVQLDSPVVVDQSSDLGYPAVAPDESAIVYGRTSATNAHQLVWSSATAPTVPVPIDCVNCTAFAVSRQGALLGSRTAHTWQLWSFDAATAAVTPASAFRYVNLNSANASPHGAKIFATQLDGSAWVVDGTTGAATPLGTTLAFVTWMDDTHLVVERHGAAALQAVFALEVP